ncbi:MAG TPA: holo-ACP synthase, partial [Rhodospirillales bacterium]|nr:holo-ACP synthase [Rhodospirillales bacterium]
MIIGIGTDLLDIRRVNAVLERFGERFTQRIYTDIECARARRRPNPAAVYAKCYAAKEACSKALGTGLRQGVFWRDMGVENLPSGQPYL